MALPVASIWGKWGERDVLSTSPRLGPPSSPMKDETILTSLTYLSTWILNQTGSYPGLHHFIAVCPWASH